MSYKQIFKKIIQTEEFGEQLAMKIRFTSDMKKQLIQLLTKSRGERERERAKKDAKLGLYLLVIQK